MIELLVVIAVISALLAILMPSLSAARKTALSVKCNANLRQQGLAFAQYAVANREWYIPSYDYNRALRGKYMEWTDALFEDDFVSVRKVYLCPDFGIANPQISPELIYDNPKPAVVNPGGGVPFAPYNGSGVPTRGNLWPAYGYNGSHIGGSDAYTYPAAWSDWSKGGIRTARTHELKFASEGYLTMDAWTYTTGAAPEPGYGALTVRDYGLTGPPAGVFSGATMPAPRHSGRAVNISFLDGHARSVVIEVDDTVDPRVVLHGRGAAFGGVSPWWTGGRPNL